jgi:mycofactocin glycosyltransferase
MKKAVCVTHHPLPPTTRLKFDQGLQVLAGVNGTTVLLGGSPYKLMTLRPAATALVEAFRSGHAVAESAEMAAVSVPTAEKLARRLLSNGMAEPLFDDAEPNPFTVAEITAVIPARNEAPNIAHVVHCLRSIGIVKVIVVDDGSTDSTAATAASTGAYVIQCERTGGPGAARNAGLVEVATKFVLFVDADTMLNDSFVTDLLIAFSDPAVAIVAPRVFASNGTGFIDRYEHMRCPLDLGPQRASVRPLTRVSYIPSAVWLARVAVIHELNGFDAGLRFGEDVDLVWRAVQAGHTVRYEGSVKVQHRPRPSIRALMKQRFGYGTSAASLDKRHPGLVTPLVASGWSVLSWALALFGGPIGVVAGVTTAVSTSAALEKKLSMLESPRSVAWKTALRGHLGVGRQLATATWRAWLPFALFGAVFSRRCRCALLAAGVLPGIEQLMKQRATHGPTLDPIRFVAMRMLDDASYCAGVWVGCAKEKRFSALKPNLANWPGKKSTDQKAD